MFKTTMIHQVYKDPYALEYLSCCLPPLMQGTPALLHEAQDGARPSHYESIS